MLSGFAPFLSRVVLNGEASQGLDWGDYDLLNPYFWGSLDWISTAIRYSRRRIPRTRQPWASLIAMEVKDVDKRTWPTRYRDRTCEVTAERKARRKRSRRRSRERRVHSW